MKKIIVSSIFIFAISFLFHSVYDWFPNFFTSLLFSVNESVWEHNKMIFMSYMSLLIVMFFLYKSDKKNIVFSTFISFVICTLLMNLIFMPLYLFVFNTEHNMIVTLLIYAFSIIIAQISMYFILKQEYSQKKEIIGAIFLVCIFLLFAYFTYYPLHIELMYDFTKDQYGLIK